MSLDWSFPLDDFQQRALAAVDAGHHVLVAAPTGSGKTVVAEHAVARTLGRGGRTFYTTPIKALSNQKFGDLGRLFGVERVGLLTGDNAINGDADVVVMTTEVLRNMLYVDAPGLANLETVVLDEVHYLQDTYRGPVWEEVIISLPERVRLVCLSATISNAAELAEWIGTVRGPTDVIVETKRPVELDALYLIGDKHAAGDHLLPVVVDGKPNPAVERLTEPPKGAAQPARRPGDRTRGRGRWAPDERQRRLVTPRRLDVIDRLLDERLLPAIYFIFSRFGCDEAAATILDGGLRLTTPEERSRLHEIADRHLGRLSDADLDVLGHQRWLAAFEAGVASHHAGLVPAFKEAVEEAFAAGLVKVVFATETLALGVNMPARTVVIENLSRFRGDHHALLTPGEFSQLTGRAGRRGLDNYGYAITLWNRFVTYEQVFDLVTSRSFHINSAFRPTYNMAANLVARSTPEAARATLERSFAQFQTDREAVRSVAQVDGRRRVLERAIADATCELGNVEDYRAAVDDLEAAKRRRPSPRSEVEHALGRLKVGDVVQSPGGEPAAVISKAHRSGGAVKLKALTADGKRLALAAPDFAHPPIRLGQVSMPLPYEPHAPAFAREVIATLRSTRLVEPDPVTSADPGEIKELERAVRRHPVHGCPDRDAHVRSSRHRGRLVAEVERLERQLATRRSELSRRFDSIVDVLAGRGFVERFEDVTWALTPEGQRLRGLYHECDLLIAEACEAGLFDGLDAPDLAGLASCFVYEHRSPNPAPPPWFPNAALARRFRSLLDLAESLTGEEASLGIPPTRLPDPTFVPLAHGWCAGVDLDAVLEDEELSGGDFVRTTKQLIDLLRQLGHVLADPVSAATARQAADQLYRGVISASKVAAAAE